MANTMAEYVADLENYTSNINQAAIQGIVKHLGIALQYVDSSLVSKEASELERVREKFLKGKLGRTESDGVLDAAVNSVMQRMAADSAKLRVTVYYLLAEHFNQLGDFA